LNLIQNETPRSGPFSILMQPWLATPSRLGLGCRLALQTIYPLPFQHRQTIRSRKTSTLYSCLRITGLKDTTPSTSSLGMKPPRMFLSFHEINRIDFNSTPAQNQAK
jgi:hypothetical protein